LLLILLCFWFYKSDFGRFRRRRDIFPAFSGGGVVFLLGRCDFWGVFCSPLANNGAFFFGRSPAMAFFFRSVCAIDFVSFLLVISLCFQPIFKDNFWQISGRLFSGDLFPAVRSSAGGGDFFGLIST